MDPKVLTVGQSIVIRRSDGREHEAAISGIDTEKKFVSVEWFENNETKGKEVDFDSVYSMNQALFRPAHSTKNQVKSNKGLRAPLSSIPRRGTVVTPGGNKREKKSSAAQGPENVPQRLQAVRARDRVPPSRSSGESEEEKDKPVLGARKSSCVREVEKLKKNREERRAKHAEQLACRAEYQDPSNPNWEFQMKIIEFKASLDVDPLQEDEPVTLSKINVCVRKRPLNRKELSKKEIDVVTVADKSSMLVHEPKTKVDLTKYLDNQSFKFDFAFDDNVSNQTVYRYTAQPLVQTVFDKGMATCFAYGQTGSGKTHTMGGVFSGKSQDAAKGIYALAAADIFSLNRTPMNAKKNLSISASFFEIYSGKVFDLLNKKERLRILEDQKQQVQIVGLAEEEVHSVEDVLRLIEAGNLCRTSGVTSANQHSSRSHAVFQLILRTRSNNRLYGKFSLIDLAGNERGADTSTSDRQTRMEGAEINRSLLALKECIRALGRKGAHLPFRGSKLTLVLKDSFVGENSRTCMIAMISPGFSSCEHTLNTLRYADRVKELRGGGAVAGVVSSPVLAHEVPPVNKEKDTKKDRNDLAFLHRSKDQGGELDLDQSSELMTFHEAISNLVASEEQLVEEHKAIIEADQLLLAEEQHLLQYVEDTDHDIEQYVTRMETIVSKKLERLTKFKERIQDLRERLQEEEKASKKVKRLPMP